MEMKQISEGLLEKINLMSPFSTIHIRRFRKVMKNLALIALALLVFLCMLLAQSCAPKTKPAAEINEFAKLAYEGGTLPLTTTPVVGTPNRKYNSTFKPGAEPLDPDEIRVTILGSGDPFVKRGQASASVLIEVGNE